MNNITKTVITSAAVLALAGCSSSTPAASQAPTTDNANVLRVGMECNYAPFNWSTTTATDTSKPISSVDYCDGYDVVMATKLAEDIGRDVQIVKLDWDNLILSLQNNQIDAIIAGMTNTPERSVEVDFTSPYYVSEEVLIVRADSAYASASSLDDFSGANVVGQMNTIYDEVIDQIPNVNHMPAAETFPAAIQALQAGGVDAVTSELPVANGVVSANKDLAIVRFAEGNGFDADTSVSIAVRKEDSELRAALEEALGSISVDQRNQMMEEAVDRQPASAE